MFKIERRQAGWAVVSPDGTQLPIIPVTLEQAQEIVALLNWYVEQD
jgi:hypothetical protein